MSTATGFGTRVHRIHMAPDLPGFIEQQRDGKGYTREFLGVEVQIGRFSRVVLSALNAPDLAVVTTVNVLAKLLDKHKLMRRVVAGLANSVLKPIAIYKSASTSGSIVVLSAEIVGERPLIGSFVLNKASASGRQNVHWMTSAYPKENDGKFAQWERDGLLLWKAHPGTSLQQEAR
ncbi:hypothetical protein [Robbsia sp. KACC 23696]|uniref:MuF-C-terminal domain-containing protein n=1 Tax=Robbsia sp. KACC 23696 TaxID=3149231 RepID=UPI00325B2CB9